MPRGNHDEGKKGELKSWEFLRQGGFIRPSKDERNKIAQYFKEKGLTIEKRGFDVILAKDQKKIGKSDICLYEVKTTGEKRGAKINDDCIGLGFTLTEKEYKNAKILGRDFFFLFVNLAHGTIKKCRLTDFFNKETSRIYKTWSVFIEKEIDIV